MNRSVTAIVVIIIALAVVGFIVYRSMRSKTGEVISSTAEQNTQNPVAETPAPTPTSATTQEALRNDMHRITIETNHGTIQFQTYDADAPKASSNFVALA
ncbi:MAG: hypothetical protein Q8R13_06025, partial [bacterium]|nr:hypothetical protein [bacterium]